MAAPITFLGIDPGLTATGWGVIAVEGSKLSHIANGTITSNARLAIADRLVEIETGLVRVVDEFAPHAAAVEHLRL